MRKTERVTIEAAGRDHGKTFVITEMDAWSAVRFAARVMLSLAQSGTDLKSGSLAKAAAGGPEQLAALGLQIFAMIPVDVALPLLEETRDCVKYQPSDERVKLQPIYRDEKCQIEEVPTWSTLLRATFELHLSFFEAATLPTSG